MKNPFICTQFPITPVSAECYKERKAGASQTLTGLGKWWGRKPLILVRASLLGLLMPSTGDLSKDRKIFLKILTMDDDGLWQRCKGEIPGAEWLAVASKEMQKEYFGTKGFKAGLSKEKREEIQDEIWETLSDTQKATLDTKRRRVHERKEFDKLSYTDRIRSCERPENIDGPTAEAWKEINEHLETTARTIPDLFQQLAVKRYGERVKVGDAFCGGGSIPFEAARVGCDAYASDLNPIACLLTWGALNVVGGGKENFKKITAEQKRIYLQVEKQIEEWGIERSEEGYRAEYYLYCVEVQLPDGWRVPLSPTWVVGQKTNTIVELVPDYKNKRYDFKVRMGVTPEDMKKASVGTLVDGSVHNPAMPSSNPIKLSVLRGDRKEVVGKSDKGKDIKEGRNNLRRWGPTDWKPKPDDFYQERVYCIRWRKPDGTALYREPTAFDHKMENKVDTLLSDRFTQWQRDGNIPSMQIEPGSETSRLLRERGWAYWHQLYTPRQLLELGLWNSYTTRDSIIAWPQTLNFSSKLCVWSSDAKNELTVRVFTNQALNTINNPGTATFF